MSTPSTPCFERGRSSLSLSRQLTLVLRQPPTLSNLVLARKLQPRNTNKALHALSSTFSSSRLLSTSASRFMLAEIRGSFLILYPISAHLTLSTLPNSKLIPSSQIQELEHILDMDVIKASADQDEIIVINLKNLRIKPDGNSAIAIEVKRSSDAHVSDNMNNNNRDAHHHHDHHHGRESRSYSRSSSQRSAGKITSTRAKLSSALSALVRGRKNTNNAKNNHHHDKNPRIPSPLNARRGNLSPSASSLSSSSSRASLHVSLQGRSYCAEDSHLRKTFSRSVASSATEKSRPSKRREERVELRFSSKAVADAWTKVLLGAVGGGAHRKARLSDFDVVRMIGKGAGGQVFHVRDVRSGEDFALKVMDKTCISRASDLERRAVDERLLTELTRSHNHPFILRVRYAFQTELRLYLVTDYCEAGNLFECLRRRGREPLPTRVVRRVLAQIILAVEHIHSIGAIHGDLNLKNILIDHTGHIRLAHFGATKALRQLRLSSSPSSPSSPRAAAARGRTQQQLQEEEEEHELKMRSLSRTRECISVGESTDVWSIGVVLYELVCGRQPFWCCAGNEEERHNGVMNNSEMELCAAMLKMARVVDPVAANLIARLLEPDVAKRIGCGENGIAEVREHEFFDGVEWEQLLLKVPHEDNVDAALVAWDEEQEDFYEEEDHVVEVEELPKEFFGDLNLEEERRELKTKSSNACTSGVDGHAYQHRMVSEDAWSCLTPGDETHLARTCSGSAKWKHASASESASVYGVGSRIDSNYS